MQNWLPQATQILTTCSFHSQTFDPSSPATSSSLVEILSRRACEHTRISVFCHFVLTLHLLSLNIFSMGKIGD